MKTEVKTKWVKALESGDYTQCTGDLYRKGSYCAYGVLCDLYAKEKGVKFDSLIKSRPICSLIPTAVSKWAGIGRVTFKDRIVQMNDPLGYSFAEIAKYIQENIKEEGE